MSARPDSHNADAVRKEPRPGKKPSVHDNPTSESSTQHRTKYYIVTNFICIICVIATRTTAWNHIPSWAQASFSLGASDSNQHLRSSRYSFDRASHVFGSPKARPCAVGVMLSDFSTGFTRRGIKKNESVRWPTFRFRMLDRYRPGCAKLHTPDLYLNFIIWRRTG